MGHFISIAGDDAFFPLMSDFCRVYEFSIAEKAQSHKNHKNDYRRSDHGRKSSIPELLWSNENTH